MNLKEIAKKYGREFEFYDRRKDVDAAFIKNLRKKLDMTRAYFAVVFGVSPSTVTKWESGESKVNAPTALLLYMISKEPWLLAYAFTDDDYEMEKRK